MGLVNILDFDMSRRVYLDMNVFSVGAWSCHVRMPTIHQHFGLLRLVALLVDAVVTLWWLGCGWPVGR